MAFFTKPAAAATAAPTPLTRERLESLMTRREWYFGIDDDGDLGGVWDDNTFYFLLVGEPRGILQIRGRWSRTLSAADQAQVALLANEVNQSKIWPKVYSRVEGDQLGVYAEVSTDLEFGVADDQLGQLVECGLFSGLQFFEQLDERFPAPDAGPADANVYVEDRPL